MWKANYQKGDNEYHMQQSQQLKSNFSSGMRLNEIYTS